MYIQPTIAYAIECHSFFNSIATAIPSGNTFTLVCTKQSDGTTVQIQNRGDSSWSNSLTYSSVIIGTNYGFLADVIFNITGFTASTPLNLTCYITQMPTVTVTKAVYANPTYVTGNSNSRLLRRTDRDTWGNSYLYQTASGSTTGVTVGTSGGHLDWLRSRNYVSFLLPSGTPTKAGFTIQSIARNSIIPANLSLYLFPSAPSPISLTADVQSYWLNPISAYYIGSIPGFYTSVHTWTFDLTPFVGVLRPGQQNSIAIFEDIDYADNYKYNGVQCQYISATVATSYIANTNPVPIASMNYGGQYIPYLLSGQVSTATNDVGFSWSQGNTSSSILQSWDGTNLVCTTPPPVNGTALYGLGSSQTQSCTFNTLPANCSISLVY
jgi:hypothetical protein